MSGKHSLCGIACKLPSRRCGRHESSVTVWAQIVSPRHRLQVTGQLISFFEMNKLEHLRVPVVILGILKLTLARTSEHISSLRVGTLATTADTCHPCSHIS